MFPIDSSHGATGTRRAWRSSTRSSPRAGSPGSSATSCRRCFPAGRSAGRLIDRGRSAARSDRAGSGRVSRSARPRAMRARAWSRPTRSGRASGNVSAGTSVFAMIVLERSLSRDPRGDRHRRHARRHARGDGPLQQRLLRPRRVDGRVRPGRAARSASRCRPDELYERLLPLALAADPDAGGLLSINYVSGEHLTGFSEGGRSSSGTRTARSRSRTSCGRCASPRSAPCGAASNILTRRGGRDHRGDPRPRRLLQGRRDRPADAWRPRSTCPVSLAGDCRRGWRVGHGRARRVHAPRRREPDARRLPRRTRRREHRQAGHARPP